jgi:enoyl-CoA hydratase
MTASPHGTVELRVDDVVATVLLNRPDRLNAISPEMLDALESVIATIDERDDIRAVVLSSAGERAFCAGADINRFRALDGTAMWAHWTRRGHQVFDRLASLRQPTVVAIDGDAHGGGLEIALACDLRVMASDATIGLTEATLGTVPGWGGTHRLARAAGASRAKLMVLAGEPVNAPTALAWGVVQAVTPRVQVLPEAHALAHRVAGRAPVAVQMAKQAIDASHNVGNGLIVEGLAAAASAAEPDFAEGLAAFTERRPALFTGISVRRPVPEAPEGESP